MPGNGLSLRLSRRTRVEKPPFRSECSMRDLKEQAVRRWRLRRFAADLYDASAWRPSHARLLAKDLVDPRRNDHAGLADAEHVAAAAAWLARAQDATGDGGIAGRYRLRGGWTSSYPETTGYIVPTFLALAESKRYEDYRDRARRAVEFLLSVQLPDGGFPAHEIAENRVVPSVFNTSQIIGGLTAYHAATHDPTVLEAARRAAQWVVAMQDADGVWRRHCYNGVVTAYMAHASCWLADFGRYADERACLAAAGRHLDWLLRQHDPETGWFDRAGFLELDHEARQALTHTIAYTLAGVLKTSEVLGREDGVEAVRRAAVGVARRLEVSRWLPGMLDASWRSRSTYACLTGNAQFALIWLRLHELESDVRLVNAALRALDLVKAAQPMRNPNPGIRGGVPGSWPIWGDYIKLSLPNWAAKFLVDALLAKSECLTRLSARPRGGWTLPADVPQTLPERPSAQPQAPLRVVMYTASTSHKVPQMVSQWASWGFAPAAVVTEPGPSPPRLWERVIQKVSVDGVAGLRHRLTRPRPRTRAVARQADVFEFCRERGIPVVEVERLNSDDGVATVRRLAPDLAIHAGAGILRAPLLSVPRLGTLNAHMGLLPYYRGMNVSEWARFNGDPVGCTVHFIDPGIDTGDILAVRVVDPRACRNVGELRATVDEAQIALLGEVTRYILTTGESPPARTQTSAEGVQFFRMHPDLSRLLEEEMQRTSERPVSGD